MRKILILMFLMMALALVPLVSGASPVVSVTNPIGNLTYEVYGENIETNFTITDADGDLASCLVEYPDNTNTSIICQTTNVTTDNYTTSTGADVSTLTTQWNAQTFTAGTSGNVTIITIKAKRDGSAHTGALNITAIDSNNHPDFGTIYAQATFDTTPLGAGETYLNITMLGLTNLVAGNNYSLVGTCESCPDSGNDWNWYSNTAGNHSNGAFQSADDGSSWSSTDRAFHFEAFVEGSSTASLNATFQENATFWAVDGANDWVSNTTHFNYLAFKTSETWENPINELTNTTFQINVSYDDVMADQFAYLNYNNTRYPATITTQGNNRSFVVNIQPPNVGTSTSINFFWEMNMTNTTNVIYFNTSTQSQSVTDLSVLTVAPHCSAGLFPAFTFNIFDEGNISVMNTSVEYNVKYGTASNTSSYTVYGSIASAHDFSICVNETTSSYVVGLGEIQYGGSGYSEERFYIFNGVAVSNQTTTNHSLLDLYASDGSSFLFRARETTLIPLQNHFLSLLRWYPDLDEYKISEIGRTDENGEVVMKVYEEDVDYRIGVYNSTGSLLKLTDPTRMVCLVDPCEVDIFTTETTGLDVLLGIETNLTWLNDTKTFKFIYNDPSQDTTLMNLTVYKDTAERSTLICSDTSTSFTGILTCDVSAYQGILRAVVERSASPPITLETLIANTVGKITDYVGGSVVLVGTWFIASFLALAGMFISPILGLIMVVVAFIPAFMMGGITWFMFTVMIAIVLIGIHLIRRVKQNE